MPEKFKQDSKTGKFIATDSPVMAEKPISIRLPIDIDAAIRKMDDRTEFLREIITQAVRKRMHDENKK